MDSVLDLASAAPGVERRVLFGHLDKGVSDEEGLSHVCHDLDAFPSQGERRLRILR